MGVAGQFSALPMESLIGGPLQAAATAQGTLANITSDFITNVGLEKDGDGLKARTVAFNYQKPVKNTATDKDGNNIEISIDCGMKAFMCGLGYMHPDWGHGHYKGENQSTYDSYDLNEDPHDPPFLHIQAICDFTLNENNEEKKGLGVLEELLIGPHSPSGFEELLDGSK